MVTENHPCLLLNNILSCLEAWTLTALVRHHLVFFLQFDFPFVDVFRVKAFKFRPLAEECDITHDASGKGKQRLQSDASRNSVWNCDGEVLDSPTLEFR